MSDPKSLLSSLLAFTAADKLPALSSHSLHLYAPESLQAPWEALQDLAVTAEALADGLQQNSQAPAEAKTIALLKQYMSETSALFSAGQDTQRRVQALQQRNTEAYGEDIPQSQNRVPDWCIERIESWGKDAKMECFKDPHPAEEGHDLVTIVFGGKVLVIDIVLKVSNVPTIVPRLQLVSVKSTLAASQAQSESHLLSAETVDKLLFDCLEKYIAECQKPPLVQDSIYARVLANTFKKHLQHLSELDRFTVVKELGDSLKVDGVSWLEEVGMIGRIYEQFSQREIASLSSLNTTEKISLDLFLLRGHGLPLTNLASPSVTVLVHTSPMTHLSMSRLEHDAPQERKSIDDQWNLDIPLSSIRSFISSPNAPHRAVYATLHLAKASRILQATKLSTHPELTGSEEPNLTPPLRYLPNAAPQERQLLTPLSEPGELPRMWILDFMNQMIVLSKSRMRTIQNILDPSSCLSITNSTQFHRAPSWLNLLFDPLQAVPQERYTTLIPSVSPHHPPVRVTLSAPQEPGFIFGRVAVRSLHQVWAIVEVLKEQAWLNESLGIHPWQPAWQRPMFEPLNPTGVEMEASPEDEIAALLNQTLIPQELQVAASIMSSADHPFGQTRASIKLQIPSKSYNFIPVEVVLESSEPNGIYVTVNGMKNPSLAEMARRGGFLSICGRVWAEFDVAPARPTQPILDQSNFAETIGTLADL